MAARFPRLRETVAIHPGSGSAAKNWRREGFEELAARLIADELKDLPSNPSILDIATGPAFLLLELGKRIPSASLTGQDAAEPMIRIAREEAARAGLTIQTITTEAAAMRISAKRRTLRRYGNACSAWVRGQPVSGSAAAARNRESRVRRSTSRAHSLHCAK